MSPAVAAALSAGALNGARGNSGVILSQILRGIADVTAGPRPTADGELPTSTRRCWAPRCGTASSLVVSSMGGQAVPGTIVSVLQAAAGAAERCAADGEELVAAVAAARRRCGHRAGEDA